MGQMDKYDDLIEKAKKELFLRKAIFQEFNELTNQNNFSAFTRININSDLEAKKSLLLQIIEELKMENTPQDVIDEYIKEEEELGKAVYDEKIGMFSEKIKKDVSKKLPNKVFFNSDLKKEIKPKYKIEFTKPLEFEPEKKMIIPPKKIPAKWHALRYLLELKAENSELPVNTEGNFIKCKIEETGRERAGGTGQSFYRKVVDLLDSINDNTKLKQALGHNWKEKMISFFSNDSDFIEYLNKNY